MKLPLELARRGRLSSPYLRGADLSMVWHADLGLYLARPGALAILTGNEITDAVRAAGVQGDGRAVPDGSFGVWEATTNLIENGGFESGIAGWVEDGGALTQVAQGVKFGAAAGKVVTADAVANEGIYHPFAGAAATKYSLSTWVSGAGTARLALYDDISGKQASAPVTLIATPQRITIIATTGPGSSVFRLHVETDVQQATTFYVDGAQVEAKPVPTPYVETDGGAAARAAAKVQIPSSFLDWGQGWLAARVRLGWASADQPHDPMLIFDWGDDPLTKVVVRLRVSATQVLAQRNNGTATRNITFAAGEIFTVVMHWDATLVYLSVNGNNFSGAASVEGAETPAATMSIGAHDTFPGNEGDLDILWFACGKGVLTNADASYIAAKFQENFRWFSGWH